MTTLSTSLFTLDVDYFKRNFLNPKVWDEKHTVFESSNVSLTTEIVQIDTKDKSIQLRLTIRIFNIDYYLDNFDEDVLDHVRLRNAFNDRWNTYWSTTITIPLIHKEFTQEVFVRKFIGQSLCLFATLERLFFGKAYTPLVRLIQERDDRKELLKERGSEKYQKLDYSVKEVISETTWNEHYVALDQELKDIQEEIDDIHHDMTDEYLFLSKDHRLFKSYFNVKDDE